MKIALLICDDAINLFPHRSGSYVDMFNRLFEGLDAKVELSPFDVRRNEYPKDLRVFDGFLTTGSACSVYENVPWINELKNFIRKLFDNGQPYFGICFGHQLIAESLGGKVAKSDEGWMVGVKRTEIIKQQKWMLPQQSHCLAISSHQDQIVELPPQTEVIGRNQGCQYSMIKLGEHFIGFQGHPEFRKDYALPLMESRRDRIAVEIIESARPTFAISPDFSVLGTWICNFFTR